MHHVRRTFAGLVAGLVALTVLPSIAAADIMSPASGDPAEIAAGWIARELDESGGSFDSLGGTADAILALDTAGVAQQAAVEATADLEDQVAAVTSDGDATNDPTAGTVAKVLLAAAAQGRNVNAFGGVDLEAELRADKMPNGMYGENTFAAYFVQALAIQALSRTTDGAPDDAVAFLRGGQCDDGGFSLGTPAEPCSSNVDTTALAVHALLATGVTADDVDVDEALDYLVAQQDVTGFVGGSANANSTGLAASALARGGRTETADFAAGAVRTLQVVCFGPDAAHGAIGFTPEARDGAEDGIDDGEEGSFLLATAQAIFAFTGEGYDEVSNAEATDVVPTSSCFTEGYCPDADSGVTVVVDDGAADSEPSVRCVAHEEGMDGLDGLYRAGHRLELEFSQFGASVCAINGTPDREACFTDTFWGYFQSSGGDWAFAQTGPSGASPQPGDSEGWRFGDGSEPRAEPRRDEPTEEPTDEPTEEPTDEPTEEPTDEPAELERTAGDTRYATAIEISQRAFGDDEADTVVLARGDLFADALAGTPVAIAANGPLLLTETDTLLDEVLTEVDRVLADGGTVHLLGGTVALSDDVRDALVEAGYEVERIAGDTRFATSVAIAEFLGDPDLQLLTTGLDFPDAVAAGTVAGLQDGAVLLTDGSAEAEVVSDYLDANAGTRFAIGGPAVTAYPDATPVTGDTRDETATAVATEFFDDPTTVGIARRDDFADALTGGTDMVRRQGPIVLVAPDAVTDATSAYLCETSTTVEDLSLYGGPEAIDPAIESVLRDRTAGVGC